MGFVFYGKIKIMATAIYKTANIYLIDGTEVFISPLKIKYLKEFMNVFSLIKESTDEDNLMSILLECTRVCMKQHYPSIATSIDVLEDNIDINTMHTILDICAGVKLNSEKDSLSEQAMSNTNNTTWEDLDLAKIEAEVFMLGKWKNFDELEESLCMAEMSEILNSKRELDFEEKKFFAAIQGVDLEKDSNRGQKEWEDMKARVFSRGKATDSRDILALQGENAKKAGFGIGLGLDYEDLR